jgi:LysR family pca operon transcriptional activator
VRSKSGAALTESGVAFMRYAGPCVQALRQGVNSLRSGEHAPVAVRLGVLSTVESLLVPEVICRLHAKHPALVVSVATGPSAYLLSQLRLGELDLVVGRMTDSPQILGLSFEHLYSESMTLVVREGHPLLTTGEGSLTLEDFPVVLPLAGTTIRQFADSLFVQHGIEPPRQRLETLSLTLSRRYVQCSDAVWIAPYDAVRQDLQAGELVELELGIREPGGSVGLCSNPALGLSIPAQWCVETLREVGQAYREGTYP